MLSSLDKTLTKFAQKNLEKFNQAVSPEEPKTPSSQFSSSRLLPNNCSKQAALFIRNSLRNVLRKHFRKMLSRMLMRRACWRLLKSNRRREMEKAFLLIREFSNRQALESIHKFYKRLPEVRIMVALCSRILAKPERRAVTLIRGHSLRRKRVYAFIETLEARLSVGILREAARMFLSTLCILRTKQRQKQLACQAVFKWTQTRVAQTKSKSISHLMDFVLGSSCHRDLEEWRGRKEKLSQKGEDRKQALAKVRQNLKTAKAEYDQEKGNRNKVYQEHKKVSHSNKAQMGQLVKTYQKERKAEEAEHSAIKEELEVFEGMLQVRETIGNKNRGAQEMCFRSYRLVAAEESEFKGLERIIPSIGDDLVEFKQSANYLFLKNLQMQKLIDLYQRRQPYNYEAKYYDLEYENRVVRETMRCFVREKFQADVSRHRWQHHHLKRPSLEEQQEEVSDQ